jgi:hypothetical protein
VILPTNQEPMSCIPHTEHVRAFTILDTIHHLVSHPKHNASETRRRLCPHVEPTQLGPTDRARFHLWTSVTTPVGFVEPIQNKPNWCHHLCPETDISHIHRAQLSRLHPKTEAETSLRNVVFQIKDRMADNVQNGDSYINMPSSQIHRFYITAFLICVIGWN